MKMIIYTYTGNYAPALGVDLIPMGIEGVYTGSADDTINIIKQDKSIVILLTENVNAEFITSVKKENPEINIFLIITKGVKSSDIIALKKYGIVALINYSDNTSLMAEEIVKNIIMNNIRSNDKRFHIRVQPKEHEDLKVAIFIRNLQKFVRGKVIDISAGGLAIKLDSSLDASLLMPKTVYDPVIVSIMGTEVKTLASMIAKRGDIAGFKFDNVEQKDMKKIATYIHNRITENTKNLMNEALS